MTGKEFKDWATGAAIFLGAAAALWTAYRTWLISRTVFTEHEGEPSLSNPISRAVDGLIFGTDPATGAPKKRLGDWIYEKING